MVRSNGCLSNKTVLAMLFKLAGATGSLTESRPSDQNRAGVRAEHYPAHQIIKPSDTQAHEVMG